MVTLQAPQPLFLIGANAPYALLPSNRTRNRSSIAFAAGCCVRAGRAHGRDRQA